MRLCLTLLAVLILSGGSKGFLFNEIEDALSDAKDKIEDIFANATETIEDMLKDVIGEDIVQDALEGVKETAEGILEDGKDQVEDALAEVKETAEDMLSDGKDKVEDALAEVKETAEDTLEDGKDKVEDSLAEVKETAEDTLADGKDKVEDALAEVKETVENMLEDGGKEKIQDALADVKDKVEDTLADVKDMLQNVWASDDVERMKTKIGDALEDGTVVDILKTTVTEMAAHTSVDVSSFEDILQRLLDHLTPECETRINSCKQDAISSCDLIEYDCMVTGESSCNDQQATMFKEVICQPTVAAQVYGENDSASVKASVFILMMSAIASFWILLRK